MHFLRAITSRGLVATPDHTVAVIVPYRNEMVHLQGLLNSLLSQDFPRKNLELIFVNDHSTDGGDEYLEVLCADAGAGNLGKQARVRHLSLRDHLGGNKVVAYKKAALEYGISTTGADIILTTDADCYLPPDLLTRVVQAFQPGIEAVSGPVFIAPAERFGAGFQALDLAAYQFLTAANVAKRTPVLANGACFAFRRRAFERVHGYAGVDHLPSGDDVLLLHKFRAHFPGTAFAWLSDGPVVTTLPVRGWRALWRQRLRWAGKSGNYRAPELTFAQGLTFSTCVALLTLVGLAITGGSWPALLFGWLAKALVDYRSLQAILRHYGALGSLRYFLPAALLYPLFLVAVGSAALLGFRTGWKGRKS